MHLITTIFGTASVVMLLLLLTPSNAQKGRDCSCFTCDLCDFTASECKTITAASEISTGDTCIIFNSIITEDITLETNTACVRFMPGSGVVGSLDIHSTGFACVEMTSASLTLTTTSEIRSDQAACVRASDSTITNGQLRMIAAIQDSLIMEGGEITSAFFNAGAPCAQFLPLNGVSPVVGEITSNGQSLCNEFQNADVGDISMNGQGINALLFATSSSMGNIAIEGSTTVIEVTMSDVVFRSMTSEGDNAFIRISGFDLAQDAPSTPIVTTNSEDIISVTNYVGSGPKPVIDSGAGEDNCCGSDDTVTTINCELNRLVPRSCCSRRI